jgi:lipoyl(octanoyl) transferase
VLASREQLAARGVEVFECDRGGDVTYHGPGQLVGYPIFDLRALTPKVGAVEFVRRLEEVLIRTCADFGIATQRVAGRTGVWTEQSDAKIAAIGVHISRGVTSHGFALNVSTDLEAFQLIVPCGIADKSVTSLGRELGNAPTLEKVKESAARNFGAVFQSQVLWVENLDALLGGRIGVPVRLPAELRQMREETTHGEEENWA